MIPAWSEYLLTQGARLSGEGPEATVADFGDAAAELAASRETTVLADLSHWGLIGFIGEEAQTFLHGQVTNDLRGLDDAQAVFAAFCSPKGRMLANFLVFRRAGELLMLLPGGVREAAQKRLSMFILRAKVKARDASPEWVGMGLSGPGAEVAVSEVLGRPMPAVMLGVAQSDSAFAVRLGSDRFDLFVIPAEAPAAWQRLATLARPVGAPAWENLLVNAGVPTIVARTQDEFVPQMANMDALFGVSFNKGCYPGQEIVARTQYLGKLKKRLFLAHVEDEAAPGDALYSPDFGQQAAGMVANAAPAPGGGHDLLAVLQISSFEKGEVHLKAPDGPRLAFKPLPYPLP